MTHRIWRWGRGKSQINFQDSGLSCRMDDGGVYGQNLNQAHVWDGGGEDLKTCWIWENVETLNWIICFGLCPLPPLPKFICWNSLISVWWYWEVIRSWGCSPHDLISILLRGAQRACSVFFCCVRIQAVVSLDSPEEGLTRTWPCWHPDLTSSLQKCEKQTSVLYKLPKSMALCFSHPR